METTSDLALRMRLNLRTEAIAMGPSVVATANSKDKLNTTVEVNTGVCITVDVTTD